MSKTVLLVLMVLTTLGLTFLVGYQFGSQTRPAAAALLPVEAPAEFTDQPVEPVPAQVALAAAAPAATVPAVAMNGSAPAVTADHQLLAFAGETVRSGLAGGRRIALTFDDGPHPTLTPQFVALLREEGVPATFFMLGSMVEKSPALARMVAEAGFEIGTHSQTHPDMRKLGAAKIREELEGSMTLIEQASGVRPRLFRPPFGSVNQSTRDVCRELGLVLANWSVDPEDWRARDAASIHGKVVNGAHPGGIICMHDTKPHTLTALRGMITELRAQGYEFVTVGQLVGELAALGPEANTGVVTVPAGQQPPPAGAIPLDEILGSL